MIDDAPGAHTAPVEATVGGHGHHSTMLDVRFPLSVLFMYHPDRPYSVLMDITATIEGEEAQVKRWELDREMLHSTVVWGSPAGIGDVQLSTLGSELLQVRLVDPHTCPVHDPQHLDMHLPRRAVQAFLMRSLRAVPAGKEAYYLDIDRALERLFS